MLTKMVALIDMLGAWVESRKPGKFKCTRVILKYFAMHVGLHIDNIKFTLPHSLMSSIRRMMPQRAIDMAMYSALEAQLMGQAA